MYICNDIEESHNFASKKPNTKSCLIYDFFYKRLKEKAKLIYDVRSQNNSIWKKEKIVIRRTLFFLSTGKISFFMAE